MNTIKHCNKGILLAVCCLVSMGVVNAAASDEPTVAGTKLAFQYQARLASLKVDPKAQADYQAARKAEEAASAAHKAAAEALGKNRSHVGLLNHRKAWISRATKGVADAKVKLAQAKAMTGDQPQRPRRSRPRKRNWLILRPTMPWRPRN